MTAAFIAALIALLVVGWFAFERQRETYEQLARIMERDREEARHEGSVFRRIVLPIYDKAESGSPVKASSEPAAQTASSSAAPAKQPAPAGSPDPLAPIFSKRTPFRIRFNRFRKLTNTKQQAHDALAVALEHQKPAARTQEAIDFLTQQDVLTKEKPHVEAR